MRLVVDASVAFKWLVREEHSELALQLARCGHELHAPNFLAAELASGLREKVRAAGLGRDAAVAAAAAIPDLGIRWAEDRLDCSEALELALELDWPVYDCFYFALSRRCNARFVTNDRKFADALRQSGRGDRVMRLEELAAELERPAAEDGPRGQPE